jgi:hypothetical protein
MIKNLVVVVSGGALAFGLAGAVSPAMALASVTHPAGATRANLPMPEGTPIIRGSNARPSCGHSGQLGLLNPSDTPIIRDSVAQAEPPTVRDAKARPGGAECGKLMNPSDSPIIRGSTAQFGDPDDGGQVHAAARLGDPDDGGEVTQASAQLGDPDDGGHIQVFAALGDPDDGGE